MFGSKHSLKEQKTRYSEFLISSEVYKGAFTLSQKNQAFTLSVPEEPVCNKCAVKLEVKDQDDLI